MSVFDDDPPSSHATIPVSVVESRVRRLDLATTSDVIEAFSGRSHLTAEGAAAAGVELHPDGHVIAGGISENLKMDALCEALCDMFVDDSKFQKHLKTADLAGTLSSTSRRRTFLLIAASNKYMLAMTDDLVIKEGNTATLHLAPLPLDKLVPPAVRPTDKVVWTECPFTATHPFRASLTENHVIVQTHTTMHVWEITSSATTGPTFSEVLKLKMRTKRKEGDTESKASVPDPDPPVTYDVHVDERSADVIWYSSASVDPNRFPLYDTHEMEDGGIWICVSMLTDALFLVGRAPGYPIHQHILVPYNTNNGGSTPDYTRMPDAIRASGPRFFVVNFGREVTVYYLPTLVAYPPPLVGVAGSSRKRRQGAPAPQQIHRRKIYDCAPRCSELFATGAGTLVFEDRVYQVPGDLTSPSQPGIRVVQIKRFYSGIEGEPIVKCRDEFIPTPDSGKRVTGIECVGHTVYVMYRGTSELYEYRVDLFSGIGCTDTAAMIANPVLQFIEPSINRDMQKIVTEPLPHSRLLYLSGTRLLMVTGSNDLAWWDLVPDCSSSVRVAMIRGRPVSEPVEVVPDEPMDGVVDIGSNAEGVVEAATVVSADVAPAVSADAAPTVAPDVAPTVPPDAAPTVPPDTAPQSSVDTVMQVTSE